MDPRIKAALRIIETRFNEKLCVTQLTASLGVSGSHFRYLFRKETGITFQNFLREARLREAARLLLDDGLSIKEIALSIGYRHVSNFNRDFSRRFSITPSRYRARRDGLEQSAFLQSDSS